MQSAVQKQKAQRVRIVGLLGKPSSVCIAVRGSISIMGQMWAHVAVLSVHPYWRLNGRYDSTNALCFCTVRHRNQVVM